MDKTTDTGHELIDDIYEELHELSGLMTIDRASQEQIERFMYLINRTKGHCYMYFMALLRSCRAVRDMEIQYGEYSLLASRLDAVIKSAEMINTQP